MIAAIIDILAARLGIWALARLYGPLCKPPYEPGCIQCDAGRMVVSLREVGE